MDGTTDSRTPAHRWADLYWTERFGYPLTDWIHDRRDRDATWRQISNEIAAMTGIEVAHPTLIAWIAAATDQAAA